MHTTFDTLAAALWAAFILSWILAMAWISRAIKHTSWSSTVRDGVLYLISFGLLAAPASWTARLWTVSEFLGWALIAIELLSFAFAGWARVHLGRLWSGRITLRAGHKFVSSGPYRLVRHPIYTGFIAAAWSYGLITAAPTALFGAALLTGQMAWKARREESFLRAELGAAKYDAYAAKTPMLIPRFARR